MDRVFNIPVVTRTYMFLASAMTLVVTLELTTPMALYFNTNLILNKYELWRLITTFFYFDQLSLNFFFHMHFLYIYWSSLERNFFDGKTADFIFMLLFGSSLLLVLGSLFGVPFLGFSLVFMVVYVWSRRNPDQHVAILWFTFRAPWLPYVLMGIAVLFGASPLYDALGMAVGHVYWALRDVLPLYLLDSHEDSFLPTPGVLKHIFNRRRAAEYDDAQAAAA